jgi:hypothetical protein
VRRSSNGGITFNTGIPQTAGFCNTQCFYDQAPAMSPLDSNVIYLGGSANAGANVTCRSNVLTKSSDGTAFSRIDTGLHADTHAVAVAPSNPSVVYFGSDGGIWRSSNAGLSWQSINNAGFNATQFQSISLHPTDRNFSIGGTQDNGTPFLHPDTTWTRADFGDGGFAVIDQNATDTTNVTMYHTYFNQTNNLIGYGRVTTTTNAHDSGWSFFGCNGTTANNGFRCADTVQFYAPMTLGPGTPNTLYFGTDRLYRSSNQGVNMAQVSQGPFVAGSPVSSVGVSPQDDHVRIAGLRNGRVFATTTGANPLTDVTNSGVPVKYVSRAVIDPNNSNTAYVTFAGFGIVGKQIWKTANLSGGAATWTPISNGLPDVPVSSFAVDPVNSQLLYAGTDIGVFISHDGGANWSPYGAGLPRVAVFGMAIQNPNRILRIATHGRGAWEIGAAKSPAVVSLTGPASATYGDNVTFTVSVSAAGVLATPGGTVNFTDGGQTVGTATLDNSLQATLTTSLLNAGPHSIAATYNGDTIFDASSSAVFSIIVNPASLSVTVNNANRQYGQPNPVFTGTITGIKNGDNLTATYSANAGPTTTVGTYPIIPTLFDPDSKLSNYAVTLNNGTLTITPAGLSAIANVKSRLYGQANPALDGTLAGVLNNDNITATFTTVATAVSPAGTYTIVPVLNDPDGKLVNYTVTILNATLTINPAPLTVTADNKSKLLNAPNPPLTATYDGFVLGQGPSVLSGAVSCTTPPLTNSPVGSYPITCSGQSSSNYAIIYLPGTLTITFVQTGLCDGEPGHQILPPIAADGSSAFNSRRTVPAKFRVCDANGVSQGTPGVVSSFRIIAVITGTSTNTVDLPIDSGTPDTTFRWDPTAQQWIFNIDASSLAAGSTYVFRIGLADGSHIDFQFGLR